MPDVARCARRPSRTDQRPPRKTHLPRRDVARQEIMYFGGMFGAYTVYRYKYLAAFVEGSNSLPIEWGALNTAILIASSFTVASRAISSTGSGTGNSSLAARHDGSGPRLSRRQSDRIQPQVAPPSHPEQGFQVRRPPGSRSDEDFLFLLLCHDRHARPPHDHRSRLDVLAHSENSTRHVRLSCGSSRQPDSSGSLFCSPCSCRTMFPEDGKWSRQSNS